MRYAQDVETWVGYLSRMESLYADHTGGETRVWRDDWQGDTSFQRAFQGPWTHVRGWVVQEFRQWLEEYDVERVCLTEWVQRQRAERAREYQDYLDWLDTQPF